MRTRWEESAEDDLDAPATISERELRSLRRRASFGLPAVLLALVAIGGLAWTLIAGPEGLEDIQRYKNQALYSITDESAEAPAPNEPASATAGMPMAATDSVPMPPPVDSLNPPPPTPAGP